MSKKKKKKLSREDYLKKKQAKDAMNKRLNETKAQSPKIMTDKDELERQKFESMSKRSKLMREMRSSLIRKVAKEHGEEAAGALMMDMMGLSDNPLTHYLPEYEERTELRSFAPKEGTIGPIRGEQFPIDKEQE